MLEPAHVALEQLAQIGNAVFQHCDALDSHAPREALIDFRVYAAGAQHVRMHHAAAENLHPIVAFAEANFVFVFAALNIDFQRRLGEWEERRPKPHIEVIDLKEGFAEFVQNPFQMTEVRTLVDDEPLDLMKNRCVELIPVAAIGAAGTDDADRRLDRKSVV